MTAKCLPESLRGPLKVTGRNRERQKGEWKADTRRHSDTDLVEYKTGLLRNPQVAISIPPLREGGGKQQILNKKLKTT